MNLNELAQRVHVANAKWWTDINGKPIERNKGELLMLVITELSEAVEGIRKDLMDDKLPHRLMEEVEMADAKIRLLDFAAGFQIELKEISNFGESYPNLVFCENKAENIIKICDVVCQIYRNECDYSISVSGAITIIEFYCQKSNLDLDGAVEEKLAFNTTREDHSHEVRMKAGGKKF